MNSTQFTAVGDLVFHFRDEGNPVGPALVLVNSLGTDLRIWDQVALHFLPHYRVIRYDKRGHGLSACPPPPYSIRQHSQDLTGLLNVLRIAQATLVGISVGGMIALDVAAQNPARVKGLVLCDTAPKIGSAAMWNERIAALRAAGLASMTASILARWFAPDFAEREPAAFAAYGHMLARMPLDGYIGTCAAIRDADLWPDVRRVQCPALVLCGAQDQATSPQMTEELAAALPLARHTIIPDAGHLPCIEQPEIVSAEIQHFLHQ